ncbi:MAG: helix-turn-helix transcriptional regulator [Bacteroidota bacterium]
MADINNWYAMSDPAILKELGQKIRAFRLQKNLTQAEMTEKTGLSRVTISEMEKGKPISLLTFIQVLRALDRLDWLNTLTSVPVISPIQIAKLSRRVRKRATGERGNDGTKDNHEPKDDVTW